jgi:hypothetical protein
LSLESGNTDENKDEATQQQKQRGNEDLEQVQFALRALNRRSSS